MKIKAVCEATGLTDRTVRYYIEEGLIAPFYTENYLGRKTFDFSEGDILALHDIAVLRKFGFSIADIREMMLHPEQIIQISLQLQERKRAVIDEEQTLLLALGRLDESRSYTVSELAACLSEPVAEDPIPAEDTKVNIGRLLLRIVKSVVLGTITWLPVVCSAVIIVDVLRMYAYPTFSPAVARLLLLALLPTWLMLLLPKVAKKLWKKKAVKVVLLVLCVLSVPVCAIISVVVFPRSETTDIRNYLYLDANCIANRSGLFQKMFPTWPTYFVNEKQPDGSWEAVYLDAHYYYHYFQGLDYTYDIYAEWPLEEAEFDAEVARVGELFKEEYYAMRAAGSTAYRYEVVTKGSYECLFFYNGDKPFETVTESYDYYIFAYDQENLKVRYICCVSLEDGADQPYYLSLDWE